MKEILSPTLPGYLALILTNSFGEMNLCEFLHWVKNYFFRFYLIPTQDFFGIQTFPYLIILWLYILYEACKTLGFRSSARYESRNDFDFFLKSHYCVFVPLFLKKTIADFRLPTNSWRVWQPYRLSTSLACQNLTIFNI